MQKVYRRTANTIHVFHLFVIVMIFAGWLLPKKFFWMYQTTIILTFLFGLLNKGTCILTKYEWKFRRKYDNGKYDDNIFLVHYLKKYFNINLPYKWSHYGQITIVTVSFIIQVYKLLA